MEFGALVLLVLCHVQISAVSSDDMKVFPNLPSLLSRKQKCVFCFYATTNLYKQKMYPCKFQGFCHDCRRENKLERSMMKQTENAFPHSPQHCVALRRNHRRFPDVAERVWQQNSGKRNQKRNSCSLKIKESSPWPISTTGLLRLLTASERLRLPLPASNTPSDGLRPGRGSVSFHL